MSTEIDADQPKSCQAGGGIPSWRIRLRSELSCSYPMHCLAEEDERESPLKRHVDIRQCLAPYRPITSLSIPRWLQFLNNKTFYVRCILLAIPLHVFYTDVTSYPPHNLWVYMFYLTHWGHCINMTYLLCSWLCSVAYAYTPATSDDISHNAPRLAKLTWSLYSTAAPLSIAISLMYWTAIAPASSPPDAINYVTGYVTIMEHGGVCLVVLLDGILVGTVPVRVKQFVYLLFVCTAYLLWSIVNYIMHLGNGEWGPEWGDDDALYPILKWGNETRMVAAIISGFAIVVLCPAVYGLVWMLSLASIEDRADIGDLPPERCCDTCCGICCCCCCTACGKKRILWEGRRRPLLLNGVSASNVGSDGYDDEHGAMYNEMPAGRLA